MNRGEAKEKIIQISIKLFNTHGFHKITTNHIIDALSISPGTLYYHYKNKEEIIRAIFHRLVNEFNSLEIEKIEKIDLNGFLQLYFKSFPIYQKYNFFYRELTTILMKDHELHTEYHKILNQRLEQLKTLLKLAIAGNIFLKMDDHEQKHLIEILWLHYHFRPAFNHIHKKEHETLQESIEQHLYLLKPYLTPDAAAEFSKKNKKI